MKRQLEEEMDGLLSELWSAVYRTDWATLLDSRDRLVSLWSHLASGRSVEDLWLAAGMFDAVHRLYLANGFIDTAIELPILLDSLIEQARHNNAPVSDLGQIESYRRYRLALALRAGAKFRSALIKVDEAGMVGNTGSDEYRAGILKLKLGILDDLSVSRYRLKVESRKFGKASRRLMGKYFRDSSAVEQLVFQLSSVLGDFQMETMIDDSVIDLWSALAAEVINQKMVLSETMFLQIKHLFHLSHDIYPRSLVLVFSYGRILASQIQFNDSESVKLAMALEGSNTFEEQGRENSGVIGYMLRALDFKSFQVQIGLCQRDFGNAANLLPLIEDSLNQLVEDMLVENPSIITRLVFCKLDLATVADLSNNSEQSSSYRRSMQEILEQIESSIIPQEEVREVRHLTGLSSAR